MEAVSARCWLGGLVPPIFHLCDLVLSPLLVEGHWWLKPEPWKDRGRERGRWYVAVAEEGAAL